MATRRQIEQRANLAGKRTLSKRLVHERRAGRQVTLLDNRVVGVARHEQHRQVGASLREPSGQLFATPARHHHVGYQQVERRARGAVGQLERLVAVGRLQRRIA